MKATSLLREQHRSLRRLLTRVEREKTLRQPLVRELIEQLMTHLSIEDHFFLCPIADATGIRVDAYRDDLARVRNAILQAVFAELDDAAFARCLRELEAEFASHVSVVERDLLPLVDRQLRPDDLETIGDRMQTFWDAAVGEIARRPDPAHIHAAQ
jgi:hypothetical protein